MRFERFSVTPVETSRLGKVDFGDLGFGKTFADHMFSMVYEDGGWQEGEIIPYQAIPMEPGVSMLHYGQSVFEGYKAYRGVDGRVRVFRPDMNARRLHASCQRLCIPVPPLDDFVRLLISATIELVRLDEGWIPPERGQSLYIRPLIIGTEVTLEVRAATRFRFLIMSSPVGSYFQNATGGISLKVEDQFTRAARNGGLGAAKTAANYAASLYPGFASRQEGFDQVLWLDSNEHRFVEEVGAMNIFFKMGGKVITPPLGASILPGVVRDSALTLLRDWGEEVEERPIEIGEVFEAFRSGAMEEVFGAGTAAVICPVQKLGYKGELFEVRGTAPGELTQRLYRTITGIQYGQEPDRFNWMIEIETAAGAATAKPATA